ncbi:MAG: hypothetical protein M0031_10420 [Thermaerobacter sp.]|nr:hypothetical protein [Thermaerobacter sp.]
MVDATALAEIGRWLGMGQVVAGDELQVVDRAQDTTGAYRAVAGRHPDVVLVSTATGSAAALARLMEQVGPTGTRMVLLHGRMDAAARRDLERVAAAAGGVCIGPTITADDILRAIGEVLPPASVRPKTPPATGAAYQEVVRVHAAKAMLLYRDQLDRLLEGSGLLIGAGGRNSASSKEDVRHYLSAVEQVGGHVAAAAARLMMKRVARELGLDDEF